MSLIAVTSKCERCKIGLNPDSEHILAIASSQTDGTIDYRLCESCLNNFNKIFKNWIKSQATEFKEAK